MTTLLLLGASSAISQAYLELRAQDFKRIFLVARSAEKLQQISDHIGVTGTPQVQHMVADLADTTQHGEIFKQAEKFLRNITETVVCYGDLTDQQRSASDAEYLVNQFNLNATSTISLCAIAAQRMAAHSAAGLRKHRTLVAVGSVAGDRGRRSNYAYGAAKSAVATYLAGLNIDLATANVHVLTVKPGFVDTPMTAALPKGVLWASPQSVAKDIAKAVSRRKAVLYTPWFWRYIMLIIKLLPTAILRRLPI